MGQTFFTFQWDILLLEVGFVSAVSYCDWRIVPFVSGKENHLYPYQKGTSVWPLRLLLFKLMFMSGIVKLQANCPTWDNLTALEYHFATQCLPGPLAWHAHQLHPLLLRLSVAITLLIEILLPFLLLVPLQKCRIIGVSFQIILQIMIMLTGNYNFFNLLTIILCFPCIEQDFYDKLIETRPRIKVS